MTDTALKFLLMMIGRVVCGFGCHERFVESASDFGCVGKSDIQVFSAVDCKGCFFGYFTIEYDSGF